MLILKTNTSTKKKKITARSQDFKIFYVPTNETLCSIQFLNIGTNIQTRVHFSDQILCSKSAIASTGLHLGMHIGVLKVSFAIKPIYYFPKSPKLRD